MAQYGKCVRTTSAPERTFTQPLLAAPRRPPSPLKRAQPPPTHTPCHRGRADYWEARYAKDPDPFDWYQRYSSAPALRDLIRKNVPLPAAVLVAGCGTSRLTEDMVEDGFVGGIASVDRSRTAVDAMAERSRDRPSLSCAFSAPRGAPLFPCFLCPPARPPAPKKKKANSTLYPRSPAPQSK